MPYKESSINHVVKFLGISDPLLPLRGQWSFFKIRLILENGHLANPTPSTVYVVYVSPLTVIRFFIIGSSKTCEQYT